MIKLFSFIVLTHLVLNLSIYLSIYLSTHGNVA